MADAPTTLAKAKALIEAAGKADVARAEFSPRPKPELHDYRDRARNDSPAIAEALVDMGGWRGERTLFARYRLQSALCGHTFMSISREDRTMTKITLHFVQIAERTRGTNGNPIRELPAHLAMHLPRQSLAFVLRALKGDSMDWPLFELRGSEDHRWFLDTARQRAAVIAELERDADLYSVDFTAAELTWANANGILTHSGDRTTFHRFLAEQIAV